MLSHLSTCLLIAAMVLSHMSTAKRTCFTSLRLKTISGYEERDIPDFEISSFLGICSKAKKDCPGRLLEHVKNIFGPEVNPMTGNTSLRMCELFGREILPSDDPDVDVSYKVSNCGNEGYMGIGRLCCFKCKAGPYTFFHPIDNCAPTARPAWCL
ncbi:uncharacterized protein LOC135196035 [Macrobrachium nipponense]|uniref:uncharacterized protein LOC135196035 n=1 Tax=Macrobrachium nipponense TaxID=159736 RepID=UPI0030C87353